MNFNKEVAVRLRKARKLNGLSLTKLANLSGLSPSYLSLIERGERKVTMRVVLVLSKVFNCSPYEFIGDSKGLVMPLEFTSIYTALKPSLEEIEELRAYLKYLRTRGK